MEERQLKAQLMNQLDIASLKCHKFTLLQQKNIERVIQLGEDPKRVHLVGGLGVDNIKINLISKELEQN